MSSILHVRCGSDIRDSLRAAGIAGDFLEWADPICQGPVRALPEPAYLEERRNWLSHAWAIPRAEIDEKLLPISSLPERLAGHDEVCLWFEHDLFDQSILVQILAALVDATQLHSRLRIVSIDRHPQWPRFIGFGQLRPEQLPALHAARALVEPEAYALAERAWDAWRSPTATLLRSSDWTSSALPFLAGAIDRHLAEFPGERDGLGLTQRLTLQAVASVGDASAAAIFARLTSELDPAPWCGDLMYWAYLRELAAEPHALLTMLGECPAERLELTPLGHAVLAGQARWPGADAGPEFGPSRWRGGVEIRAR